MGGGGGEGGGSGVGGSLRNTPVLWPMHTRCLYNFINFGSPLVSSCFAITRRRCIVARLHWGAVGL